MSIYVQTQGGDVSKHDLSLDQYLDLAAAGKLISIGLKDDPDEENIVSFQPFGLSSEDIDSNNFPVPPLPPIWHPQNIRDEVPDATQPEAVKAIDKSKNLKLRVFLHPSKGVVGHTKHWLPAYDAKQPAWNFKDKYPIPAGYKYCVADDNNPNYGKPITPAYLVLARYWKRLYVHEGVGPYQITEQTKDYYGVKETKSAEFGATLGIAAKAFSLGLSAAFQYKIEVEKSNTYTFTIKQELPDQVYYKFAKWQLVEKYSWCSDQQGANPAFSDGTSIYYKHGRFDKGWLRDPSLENPQKYYVDTVAKFDPSTNKIISNDVIQY